MRNKIEREARRLFRGRLGHLDSRLRFGLALAAGFAVWAPIGALVVVFPIGAGLASAAAMIILIWPRARVEHSARRYRALAHRYRTLARRARAEGRTADAADLAFCEAACGDLVESTRLAAWAARADDENGDLRARADRATERRDRLYTRLADAITVVEAGQAMTRDTAHGGNR